MAAPLDLSLGLDLTSVLYVLKTFFILYASTTAVIYFCLIYDTLEIFSNKHVGLIGKRTLILTAHPDDECMFFSPAIIQLCKTSEVFVLCTTSG